MKMSDVFKDSKQIGSFDRFVCQTGYDDLATFNTEQQAQAAAHAINQHDALVAMNAELVEALGNSLSAIDIRFISDQNLSTAKSVLAKAKELSQ